MVVSCVTLKIGSCEAVVVVSCVTVKAANCVTLGFNGVRQLCDSIVTQQ